MVSALHVHPWGWLASTFGTTEGVRIGRCAPLATGCSPGTLVGDVGILLTQGVRMNATSKDVFAKRKEGSIDEAYQLALAVDGFPPEVDEWDRKAMGWCLVDLIKRDAQAGHPENCKHFDAIIGGSPGGCRRAAFQKGCSQCNCCYAARTAS